MSNIGRLLSKHIAGLDSDAVNSIFKENGTTLWEIIQGFDKLEREISRLRSAGPNERMKKLDLQRGVLFREFISTIKIGKR